MTTNKPPIAAWAPGAALAKLASRHNNSPCVLTDGPAEFNDVALVRLSDYEALQAAHEEELFQVRQDRDTHFGSLMRAIEQVDAMKAECEELHKAIRRLCNIYEVDDYYMGQLREERLEAAVNRAIEQVKETTMKTNKPDATQLVGDVKYDTSLFCDLKTDEEKSTFFLSGRGYETGVIAQAIQNDVAMAYHRCSEYRKELEALRDECEKLRKDAARYQSLLEAVLREIPHRKGSRGNAPGHAHSVPGIWDEDNGALAGKECAWCKVWNEAVSAMQEEDK